jgi:hypothetical protein
MELSSKTDETLSPKNDKSPDPDPEDALAHLETLSPFLSAYQSAVRKRRL